jgi:hypothetical protein
MSRAVTKCSDNFIEQVIDDEVVLLDLDSADFFSLSGTARDVWNLVDGARDREAIVVELAKAYDGIAEQIGEDVDAFLEQMIAGGFLQYG